MTLQTSETELFSRSPAWIPCSAIMVSSDSAAGRSALTRTVGLSWPTGLCELIASGGRSASEWRFSIKLSTLIRRSPPTRVCMESSQIQASCDRSKPGCKRQASSRWIAMDERYETLGGTLIGPGLDMCRHADAVRTSVWCDITEVRRSARSAAHRSQRPERCVSPRSGDSEPTRADSILSPVT